MRKVKIRVAVRIDADGGSLSWSAMGGDGLSDEDAFENVYEMQEGREGDVFREIILTAEVDAPEMAKPPEIHASVEEVSR